MVLVVRCSLCGDILECSKSNRQALFDHIHDKHPTITLERCRNPSVASHLGADSKCELNEIMQETEVGEKHRLSQTQKRPSTLTSDKKRVSITTHSPRSSLTPRASKDFKQSSDFKCPRGADVLYEREYQCKKPLVQKDLSKKKNSKNPKLYRTTVEKWRPGLAKIHCPKCGDTRTPIIKSTQNRVSKSYTGAACILTCWPFCFLPFLFPPPTHENLYCRSCDYFLGVYDHQDDRAKPNDEVCARIPHGHGDAYDSGGARSSIASRGARASNASRGARFSNANAGVRDSIKK